MSPEPVIARAISRAVEDYPKRRIPLVEVLRAAAAVDHTGSASAGWRSRVLSAINTLAEAGKIELPKTRFDPAGYPPMPLYLVRPAIGRTEKPSARAPVWHAELAWAAQLSASGQLSVADQKLLTKVNAWLSRRRGVHVPMRERSLEIFGDEKLLERYIAGPLFAPGRLTLAMLETFPCWPPVEQAALGAGDWLFVENYTTYHSLRERARELSFDGRIIWGSGNQIGTRLAALATQQPPPHCFYFGDIDAGGFQIARSAAAKSEQLGLPPLAPAQGLYRLALQHGAVRPDASRALNVDEMAWARSWLGQELAEALIGLVTSKRRIVQESVGKELLATTTLSEWFSYRS